MKSKLNQNRVVGAASVWPVYGVYSVTGQEAKGQWDLESVSKSVSGLWVLESVCQWVVGLRVSRWVLESVGQSVVFTVNFCSLYLKKRRR